MKEALQSAAEAPDVRQMGAASMEARSYTLSDGRVLTVAPQSDGWRVSLDGAAGSLQIGWPLRDMIAEVLGIDVTHEDIPQPVSELADRILAEVPRGEWPPVPVP